MYPKHSFRLFVIFAIFCFAGSSSLHAQDVVQQQLKKVHAIMILDDFSKTHNYEYDNLYDNEIEEYTLTLDEGFEYKIIAVCDGDCGDIDSWLYDANGNEIDEDTSEDDVPIVEVSPRWDGKFRIKIKMYECRVEPCKIGIGVFAK